MNYIELLDPASSSFSNIGILFVILFPPRTVSCWKVPLQHLLLSWQCGLSKQQSIVLFLASLAEVYHQFISIHIFINVFIWQGSSIPTFIYIYTNQTGCLCRRMLGTYSVHILPTCHVQFNNMYATWMVVEIFGSCVKIHALQACGKSEIRNPKCYRFIHACMYVLNPMMVVTSHVSVVLPIQGYSGYWKHWQAIPWKGSSWSGLPHHTLL